MTNIKIQYKICILLLLIQPIIGLITESYILHFGISFLVGILIISILLNYLNEIKKKSIIINFILFVIFAILLLLYDINYSIINIHYFPLLGSERTNTLEEYFDYYITSFFYIVFILSKYRNKIKINILKAIIISITFSVINHIIQVYNYNYDFKIGFWKFMIIRNYIDIYLYLYIVSKIAELSNKSIDSEEDIAKLQDNTSQTST